VLIAAVGDLVVMKPLRHVRERPPDSLLHVLDGADVSVGNLEVVLTDVDDPQREDIVLRGHPALIDDVAGLGVNVLSVANNHAGDHGWAALAGMVADLEQRGLVMLGSGWNVDDAYRPVGGDDVFIATATCVGLERYFVADDRPGMAGIRVRTSYERDEGRLAWEPATPARVLTVVDGDDETRVIAGVEWATGTAAKPVVVVIHWGVSWADRPAPYQRELGRKLVRAGASAVFGCHSHTVQGVEVVDGAPIFYGLGSFVFGYDGPLAARMPRDSAVALVELGPEGHATGARLVLGRLDANGEPVRAHPERAALLAEIIERNSAGWGAPVRLDGDTLEVTL
jgi:poly-gamma-glutamate capsule biosynthesis protein CapA/YwtB (metallophosphatase superfamily)